MAVTYNQKQDLVLGEGLMVYVKVGETYNPIAYARTHSLSINGQEIDTSSKMSGDWQDFLIGQLSWDVTTDSLVSDTEGHMSWNSLFDLMTEREPIDIVIGTPVKSDDEFTLSDSHPQLKGQAMISALEKTASHGEVCTSSLTLKGKGKLERIKDD